MDVKCAENPAEGVPEADRSAEVAASAWRRRGATAVEYALIVALIAGVLISIVGLVGFQSGGMFQRPVDGLQSEGW